MEQSKQIQEFYDELWKWIQMGFPYHPVFEEGKGMCSAYRDYQEYILGVWYIYSDSEELKKQFRDSGLDDWYPFGEDSFDRRQSNNTLYKCPKRLKWIKDHISENFNKKEEPVKTLYESKKVATKKEVRALKFGDIIECYYENSEVASIEIVVSTTQNNRDGEYYDIFTVDYNKFGGRVYPGSLRTDKFTLIGELGSEIFSKD